MLARSATLLAIGLMLAPTSRLDAAGAAASRPNIVLCMADDQGWGDVGYNGHPVLKTPTLDAMARDGLRLDRFYAAAPVCSPTRGSVLTGRHPNRFGCFSWGYTLRAQEITVAEALRTAGYTTGHFGKWHLGPVCAESPVSPGASGFDEWFSSPNFFENSPLMSRKGKVVRTSGEGSQVIVDEALGFIRAAAARKQPFLAVVWFGSPHLPYEALEADRRPYQDQPEKLQHYYGEITAMDRAVGNLRRELGRLGVAKNTLFWYTSDNGATGAGSTSGLRGRKGTLWEGGLRVPTVVEWPAQITKPRRAEIPCGTVDIYPTLLDVAGTRMPGQTPLDGVSLVPMIENKTAQRDKPMGFWVYPAKGIGTRSAAILEEMLAEQEKGQPAPPENPGVVSQHAPSDDLPGHAAWLEGDFKLHKLPGEKGPTYELYDLGADPKEETDLAGRDPQRVERMKPALDAWQRSVVGSLNGEDYAAASGLVPLGAAKVDITPDTPVRMYGYAARKTESEGVAGRLKATALAIGGDDGEGPAVLLAVDCGAVPPAMRETVLRRVQARVFLKAERFVLANSHCHSGPDLKGMNFMEGTEREHLAHYAARLTDRLERVVLGALAGRRPGRLAWTQGTVGFAANRRVLQDGKWKGFGAVKDAPVDHSLPLLKATDAQGKLLAVVLNYACHNTTLRGNFKQIHGDWAACAQEFIEADNPGAVALVTIGCGADSDPCPHSTVELCREHGRAMADEVQRLLAGPFQPVSGAIVAQCRPIEFRFAPLPAIDELRAKALKSYSLKRLVAMLDRGEKPPAARPYTVATWTFGNDLAMIFLSDEVVVDYALRLRRELDGARLWINAYCQEVSGYVVSDRLIGEGGYEANNSVSAQVTWGQPETLQPSMEQQIVARVRELLPERFRKKP